MSTSALDPDFLLRLAKSREELLKRRHAAEVADLRESLLTAGADLTVARNLLQAKKRECEDLEKRLIDTGKWYQERIRKLVASNKKTSEDLAKAKAKAAKKAKSGPRVAEGSAVLFGDPVRVPPVYKY